LLPWAGGLLRWLASLPYKGKPTLLQGAATLLYGAGGGAGSGCRCCYRHTSTLLQRYIGAATMCDGHHCKQQHRRHPVPGSPASVVADGGATPGCTEVGFCCQQRSFFCYIRCQVLLSWAESFAELVFFCYNFSVGLLQLYNKFDTGSLARSPAMSPATFLSMFATISVFATMV
jgi:hypothetical protein